MIRSFNAKKDKYSLKRGWQSRFYNLYCEHCGTHLLLYQKDGPGKHLKRLYLDRIVAPDSLLLLQNTPISKIPNLICKKCHRLIAIPNIYEEEERNVYLLLSHAFVKKRSIGIYPPKILKLENHELEK